MTNELVGRFNATATDRIAPSTELPIVGPIPVIMQISPAIRSRFCRLLRGGLHALQPTQHPPHFAKVKPGQGQGKRI